MADSKLTVVSSQLRGATLGAQLLCSLVAFSALAHRDALTGAAQVTGLTVYLSVFVGAVVMSSVRWLGVTARPFAATVSSFVHFSCAALVNLALLAALFLVTGEEGDMLWAPTGYGEGGGRSGMGTEGRGAGRR